MTITSTYKVRIMDAEAAAFKETARLYRGAVDFYIGVIDSHWGSFLGLSSKSATNLAEQKTVPTRNRPEVGTDFSTRFYKFPSYLRRAAIAEAFGKVSSYRSNLANWEKADPKERGRAPGIPKAGFVYPAMYKDNCFVRLDEYAAKIKVFIRNTWDWVTVHLRKSDADYITRHCKDRKECAPTLRKRGHKWYLDFAFTEEADLHTKNIFDQAIVSVDLGLNNACACSVMRSDGTVIGRRFLKLPKEYDSLKRMTDHIRKAQNHGSRCVRTLWAFAKGVNDDIAKKTARFIVDTAVLYSADTVVFERLSLAGKKKGSRRMRLHLWRAQGVQRMVEDKAHRLCMRISRVCAWNTSGLAFDGSGRALRGGKSIKTGGSYSVCEFKSGKVYNCDLNASYNIGARYFVREIIKSLPVTEGQRIEAKVPECAQRSRCTLSTLISLTSALYASA